MHIILRQVKGHRQVYLYFACIEIKFFGPLSLVLMAYLKRHISSHKKPLQIVLEKSKDISNYSVFVIKAWRFKKKKVSPKDQYLKEPVTVDRKGQRP